MRIVPITFREAKVYIKDNHRHHDPPQGMKFCIGLTNDEGLIGVCVAGRPVARLINQKTTLEITRLATDGSRNACSKLYGAAVRIAQEMGYAKVITYTLPEEGGASLRASGWSFVGKAGGGKRDRPSRKRSDNYPTQIKHKWERNLTS